MHSLWTRTMYLVSSNHDRILLASDTSEHGHLNVDQILTPNIRRNKIDEWKTWELWVFPANKPIEVAVMEHNLEVYLEECEGGACTFCGQELYFWFLVTMPIASLLGNTSEHGNLNVDQIPSPNIRRNKIDEWGKTGAWVFPANKPIEVTVMEPNLEVYLEECEGGACTFCGQELCIWLLTSHDNSILAWGHVRAWRPPCGPNPNRQHQEEQKPIPPNGNCNNQWRSNGERNMHQTYKMRGGWHPHDFPWPWWKLHHGP
jgi:hypothetical protein